LILQAILCLNSAGPRDLRSLTYIYIYPSYVTQGTYLPHFNFQWLFVLEQNWRLIPTESWIDRQTDNSPCCGRPRNNRDIYWNV